MGPAPIIMMDEISVLFGMSVPGQLGGCARSLPARKLVGLYPSPARVQGASPARGSGRGGVARRIVEDHPVKRTHAPPVALRIEDQPVDHPPFQRPGGKGDKPCPTRGKPLARHELRPEIPLGHHLRHAALGLPVERDEGERPIAQDSDGPASAHRALDLVRPVTAVAGLAGPGNHRVTGNDAVSVLGHLGRRHAFRHPIEADRHRPGRRHRRPQAQRPGPRDSLRHGKRLA
ncbi:MAG TPA: hypothetical protein DCX34_16330 [Roseovarius sp.]|nr:hypothetical protein [Roseovarius sp.]